MKKTTHILALALVLVMALGLLPISAGAVTVTEIVPPKYDEVRDFHDGLAMVGLNGKWGFIDKTGKEVVPCIYRSAYSDTPPEFHEGLAAVVGENGWGFIDTTGNVVLPFGRYDRVEKFSDGLAAVWLNGKGWGFIDKTGKEVVPCKYHYVNSFDQGLAAVELNGKWGFIDTTGKEVVPCNYDGVGDFSEGLAAVQGESGKGGFIDTTGKEVIPCQYNAILAAFKDGRAVVEASTGQIKNGHTVYAWGVIDTQGNVVVPFGKYDKVYNFSDGLAAMCVGSWPDEKWGRIDKTGQEVVPLGKYYKIEQFSDGLAAVQDENYKWGFIDTTGKEVVPCKYSSKPFIYPAFHEGFAAVYGSNGCWGFIDKTGKEVVPCTLEYYEVENFSEGLAAVSAFDADDQANKGGFVDKTGKEVVPPKYDSVRDFSDGLAAVKTSNGWGYIDLQGNEVIPCQYGETLQLSNGLVAFKLDGKWGILRVEGLPTPTPTPEPTVPSAYTAKATNDKLTVDGVSKTPTAYKINNANYFQLRDVAVLLNSTKAQFSVEYDDAAKAIKITTGQPYQPNGKEMKGAKATAEAIVGNNDVYINGVKTDFAVYKIGGSNFFQIRDLGKALGFNVDWVKDVGIIIDPSKPYSGK